jgi:hypothetical protein
VLCASAVKLRPRKNLFSEIINRLYESLIDWDLPLASVNSIGKVLAKWQADGIDLLPPSKEAQVITMISNLGQTVSRDVSELYQATSGMSEGEMDSLCFSLWPLERVATENLKQPVAGVLFADFLIDSHLYLFRSEDSDRSSIHVEHFDGKGPQRVAGSLIEFFELYLDRPEKVYL